MYGGPCKYVVLASFITLGSESVGQSESQIFVGISEIEYSRSFESVNSRIKKFPKLLVGKKQTMKL